MVIPTVELLVTPTVRHFSPTVEHFSHSTVKHFSHYYRRPLSLSLQSGNVAVTNVAVTNVVVTAIGPKNPRGSGATYQNRNSRAQTRSLPRIYSCSRHIHTHSDGDAACCHLTMKVWCCESVLPPQSSRSDETERQANTLVRPSRCTPTANAERLDSGMASRGRRKKKDRRSAGPVNSGGRCRPEEQRTERRCVPANTTS